MIRLLPVLVFLVAPVLSAPTTEHSNFPRIANGREADWGQFPSIVSLARGTAHICGGVLIDDKTVVTAKHCVTGGLIPDTARVAALFSFTGLNSGIAKVVPHPKERVDLAVVHLKQPFPKGKQGRYDVDHAELPAQGSTPKIGEVGLVAGWGLVESGKRPLRLRYTQLTVNEEDCLTQPEIPRAYFCMNSKRSSTCKGDSGGPVFRHGSRVVIGVVHGGPGKCGERTGAIFVNIGTYSDWIWENRSK
ncbi:hypothetical protein LOZ58_006227 [Ophidiomyces ophidiicola]|nr:hypothetical protein LOZ58_006227 [Ophidiomyces ophidiicola]